MKQEKKKRLPMLDIDTGYNHSPHVVILGAGASRACCPDGDKNGKPLPVMADFVGALGIEKIISQAGRDPSGNFEAIYSDMHDAKQSSALLQLDAAVRDYFSGLRLPDKPTLYDYLVLALRPKDIIVTFNWDPLLVQAYQRWRHLGPVLPQLAFLHGNVDISVDVARGRIKFTSDLGSGDKAFAPSRLLYPVKRKDYNSDPFTKDQWDHALYHLGAAYFVTIYGYSAPRTDVEARALLLKAWQDNPTQTLGEFDVVDIADKDQVKKSWDEFIVRTHGSVYAAFANNYLQLYPRRSCEAFAYATLQNDPWHDDPFPQASTLTELEEWVRPLLDEERSGKLAGKPHH